MLFSSFYLNKDASCRAPADWVPIGAVSFGSRRVGLDSSVNSYALGFRTPTGEVNVIIAGTHCNNGEARAWSHLASPEEARTLMGRLDPERLAVKSLGFDSDRPPWRWSLQS